MAQFSDEQRFEFAVGSPGPTGAPHGEGVFGFAKGCELRGDSGATIAITEIDTSDENHGFSVLPIYALRWRLGVTIAQEFVFGQSEIEAPQIVVHILVADSPTQLPNEGLKMPLNVHRWGTHFETIGGDIATVLKTDIFLSLGF